MIQRVHCKHVLIYKNLAGDVNSNGVTIVLQSN
jgi:hypothetical protein